MNSANNKPTRRDFVKTLGAALGGVSILGHGGARGRALGTIPNSYRFYRVLNANAAGRFGIFPNWLGDITGSVMMASPPDGEGIGYIYVHGRVNPQFGAPAHAVFSVAIHFGVTPPVVVRVLPMAIEGVPLFVGGQEITPGHIGTGASNALGEYVTTILPNEPSETVAVKNSPGVYLFRPGNNPPGEWSRIIGFADPVPDGSFYGGDFGDVALDNDQNLLLVAATTQSPAAKVSGYSGSQALIATSLGATASGRVVLQTGDMLPFGTAAIESVGLIDLAANHAFAAQVTAKLLDPAVTRFGTALVVGNTHAAPHGQKIVAASPELISPQLASQGNIFSGQTFFGPRVDPREDVAFVTHNSTFQESIGSNDVEMLGYYSRELPHQLRQTQAIASSDEVIGLGAPCIDSSGLMYGTELLGDGTTRLFISDGDNSQIVLRSGDPVSGIPGTAPDGDLMISEILFGQHSTQVDGFSRLAFTAEFLRDPRGPQDPSNVITALVIGIPG
jgi:hypothetical protein